MSRLFPILLTCLIVLTGCIGPVSLHDAVLGYDETMSRLDTEMLLVNIARTHHSLPSHFTVTSAIAATFNYSANMGFSGNYLEPAGLDSHSFSVGASVAENPTLSIVPVQGEEFTRRILAPMDENKLMFLIFQGVPIDMVMRLMADGIEVQERDGSFQRFILNWPTAPEEYEEFRRVVMHLAWLNDNRKLFVGTVNFDETERVELASPPSPGDLVGAREKGYSWRRVGEGGKYELSKSVKGRVAITNYDLRSLTNDQRQALNGLASSNPANFVLVDVRPGHPGGEFPVFGALKLRSLNAILTFVASGIEKAPEFDVEPDTRTGEVARNPTRVLAIEESVLKPFGTGLSAKYKGKTYSVPENDWDLQAFTVLHQLFQMTVTDVSVGIPITISK